MPFSFRQCWTSHCCCSLIALATVAATVAVPSSVLASPVPDFVCEVTPHPDLQRDGYLLGQGIYFLGDRVGLIGYAEPDEQLPQMPSDSGVRDSGVRDSGMRFSDGTISFSAQGKNGVLELEDGSQFACSANPGGSGWLENDPADQPRAARSLFGSILRAGDSPKARQLAQIRDGEAIEILAETGSFYDGWQWVRVRYLDGQEPAQEGYVWGGTLCTQGEPEITGVHATCDPEKEQAD